MEAPIVTTKNGKVKGSVHHTVPETVPVFNYRDIPFAKIQKFKKPEDYGSWGMKFGMEQQTLGPFHSTMSLPAQTIRLRSSRGFYLCRKKH